MAKKNTTILILIGLIIIAVFGGLFTIIQPSENDFIQYHISSGQEGNVATWQLGQFIRNGAQSGIVNGLPSFNSFGSTSLSNTATINTGSNIFEFISEKSNQGTTFGLTGVPPELFGCWQKITITKNGQPYQVLKSWGDDNNPDATKNFFSGHLYRVYEDETQQSWIDLRMGELITQAGIAGCTEWQNFYKIRLPDDAFDVSVTGDIQEENMSIQVHINNNLNTAFESNILTRFRLNTLLGNIVSERTESRTLTPGDNVLTYSLNPQGNEGFNVEIEADIKTSGSNLQGLNFGHGIATTYECFNTFGSGGCEQSRRYSDAGASPSISPNNNYVIGRLISDDNIVSLQQNPSTNQTIINVTVIPSSSGNNATTSSTTQPSVTSSPIFPSTSPATPQTPKIKIELIIAGVAIVLILFLIIKFFRKR